MLLMFALSGIVQFNDPDPSRWIAIYAAAAIVSGLEVTRRAGLALSALTAAVAFVWAATIAPRVIGKVRFGDMFQEFEMRDVGVEESREMYGLLLVALWMSAVALAAWRRRVRSAQGAERSEHGVGVP
jgi:hypothetical protein